MSWGPWEMVGRALGLSWTPSRGQMSRQTPEWLWVGILGIALAKIRRPPQLRVVGLGGRRMGEGGGNAPSPRTTVFGLGVGWGLLVPFEEGEGGKRTPRAKRHPGRGGKRSTSYGYAPMARRRACVRQRIGGSAWQGKRRLRV